MKEYSVGDMYYKLNTLHIEAAVEYLASLDFFGLDTISKLFIFRQQPARFFASARPPPAKYKCKPDPKSLALVKEEHLKYVQGVLTPGVFWFKRAKHGFVATATCKTQYDDVAKLKHVLDGVRIPYPVFTTLLDRHLRNNFVQYLAPLDVLPLDHTVIHGMSGTGKTTLALRQIEQWPYPVMVFDVFGEFGKYVERLSKKKRVYHVPLSVDLNKIPPHIFINAFDIALRTAGSREGANLTAVQMSLLHQAITQDRIDLPSIITFLMNMAQQNQSAAILVNKLIILCKRADAYCEPHPRLTGFPQLPQQLGDDEVVIFDLSDLDKTVLVPFVVQSYLFMLMYCGLYHDAERCGQLPKLERLVIIQDEAAMVLPKTPGVADAYDVLIRQGRHAGVRVVLITQSRRDISEYYREIVPTVVLFKIHPESPLVYGIDAKIIETLERGQAIVITRNGVFSMTSQ